jgi:hypothetical protein
MQNRKRSYDLAVAYRIYPKVSGSALSLPFGDDKYRLADICLKSFKASLAGLRVKLWVLLDGCPPKYIDLFTKYFDVDDLVLMTLNGIGNEATFSRQIEILVTQQDAEVVYFAEDDYLYLSGEFECMIDFLLKHEDAHFVSPYDHLDCYTTELHRTPKRLNVHGGRHWRTAASTCLTFLTTQETLRKTQAVFRHYKRRSFDCSLWLSLTKNRIFNPLFFSRQLMRERFFCRIIVKSWLYCWQQILFGQRWKLWVPIPGIATHLDSNALSPNVDWGALMRNASEPKLAMSSILAPRREA